MMYSRIVPATSMLERPFISPAALPQPALGNEAPAPALPVLGAPATPETPPAAWPLPALPPDPPAALAGMPAALTCPALSNDIPAAPGAPPCCSPGVPPAAVEPPLEVELGVPPLPEGPPLLELEQAIARGRSTIAKQCA
jgi:hypothetical protein